MIKIESSVQISRPVAEVFAFISDIENLPLWAGLVTDAKQTSQGSIGVGTTQSTLAQFLGQQMETTQEVTEFELNRKLSTKSTSGPLPLETYYILEPVGESTKITLGGKLDASGFFKLAEPLVGRMLNRQNASDAQTLKELLEVQA